MGSVKIIWKKVDVFSGPGQDPWHPLWVAYSVFTDRHPLRAVDIIPT